jgi:hypothetical protein
MLGEDVAVGVDRESPAADSVRRPVLDLHLVEDRWLARDFDPTIEPGTLGGTWGTRAGEHSGLATDRTQMVHQESDPEFLPGDRNDRGRMSAALWRRLVEERQKFAG